VDIHSGWVMLKIAEKLDLLIGTLTEVHRNTDEPARSFVGNHSGWKTFESSRKE
jgi:hypothetical protein